MTWPQRAQRLQRTGGRVGWASASVRAAGAGRAAAAGTLIRVTAMGVAVVTGAAMTR